MLIGITTQGVTLGYELLPLQGVLVIRACKAFALTGRIAHWHNNPGCCPGLRASALSGRADCMGLAFILRAMDFGSGRADCMGLAFVLRVMDIGSGSADYSSFSPYSRSKKAVVLTP